VELLLKRKYFPEGTQGNLEWNGTLVCYTIELPDLGNQRRISCIPEGIYILQARESLKMGWHLHLQNVPGRDLILIHPANDARKELMGCIAPVSQFTGIGRGSASRIAMAKLKGLVLPYFERDEEVRIRITSKKEK